MLLYRSSGKRGDTLRSTLQRDSSNPFGGCLPRQILPSCAIGGGNFRSKLNVLDTANFAFSSADVRRKPITVLASNGFWNGVSDLKEVFTNSRNPLQSDRSETAKFYVKESSSTNSLRRKGIAQ